LLKKPAASPAPLWRNNSMALMPVETALDIILKSVRPLQVETIALGKALGRVLAVPIYAKRDQPPFAASAMDGYAVQYADVIALPANLKIIGTSAAGHAFKGKLRQGTVVRILTGAPLPSGADTVVIQENTQREGDTIKVITHTPQAKNIRRAGLDFAKGDLLVAANTKLTPRDIGLLAAGNAATIKVYRRAKVVLFTTGDELVLPGTRPRADQIVSSNSHTIAAMLQSFGVDVVNLGIVKDNLKATITAVKKGLSADVLLTTGGASVGDHDYVQEAFKASGIKIGFWKIALRPGKPFMYGRKGKTRVMGLPGNPVSALVTARIFLKPLLNAFANLPTLEPSTTAILQGTLPANDHRQDYIRATLSTATDGRRTVSPFETQDSSMQRTMQLSHALIIRPPDAAPVQNGDTISVLLLDF
jgi:molybdopterin molybdotransferase